MNENSLIQPKRLVNPYILSVGHRELHRELLFYQKTGRNLLEKSELRKVLEQRNDRQRKQEMEKNRLTRKNSFERIIEERASKLNEKETKDNGSGQELEFIKIRAKLFSSKATNATTKLLA